MEEWKEYRLGDIIAIKSGYAYKGDMIGYGENVLLGMGCVSFKERFLLSGARAYAGDCADRYCANSGDIVLATRQQSDNLPILGMPAIIPNELSEKRIIIGANLYRVDNESDFSNEYIYWLLKTPMYVNYIRSCQSGTTVRMITKANIEDFRFKAPGRKERDRISSFFKSLDDKIEVNRRINNNLEQQAQALFKSWFVDFEPFKDSEFVESELGMIPKGWRVESLTSFGKIVCGKTPSKAESTYYGGNIPFIKIPDMHNNIFILHSEDCLSELGDKSQLVKRIPPYSILVSCIATVGLVGMNVRTCHTNQQINTIIPNYTNYRYYLYQKLVLLRDYLINLGRGGTATLNVNTRQFGNIKIVKPMDNVLTEYHQKVSCLFNKIEANSKESRRLATLRDTLLPKLMSGELNVNDIEI